MSKMTAVIPVAGLGTRLWPLTKSQSKEMLPLGRKPVVEYVIEEAALAAGFRSVLAVPLLREGGAIGAGKLLPLP